MPNNIDKYLFIIGSPKAGTTSLARWLDQRPDMVLGAEKEPRYFTDFAAQTWAGPGSDAFHATLLRNEAEYFDNFSETKTGKQRGNGAWAIDGSTDYLWCQAAAENIKSFAKSNPVKLICILRDPIDRALSEFNHTLRDRMENLDLKASLEQEQMRMDKGWQPLFYHLRRSTCLADLERFHGHFGEDLLILGFHEFKEPEKLLEKVHDFLELDGPVVAPSVAANPSVLPRNQLLDRLFGFEFAKAFARKILGRGARDAIKKRTHKPARDMQTTNQADAELLRRELAAEIAACKQSPLVNTTHWTTAIGQ